MPILTWIGKEKIVNHHQEVPYKVLDHVYTYDKSVLQKNDFISENKIIHGDNLEALKSLMPQYEGKIKCVYIDPPYNTGNESWIYNDNVNDPKFMKWLGNVVGKDGEDFSRHDKWLCMMYPRLQLLHKLLMDTGAIFISIDDNEIVYLRAIMDEIFGQRNFISQIILKCNPKGRSQDKHFASCHEYILVYAKGNTEKGMFHVQKSDDTIEKDYKLKDEKGLYRLIELRNTHREFGKNNRKNLWYPLYVSELDQSVSLHQDDTHQIEVYPYWNEGFEGCWTWGRDKAKEYIKLLIGKSIKGNWKIYRKSYAYTEQGKVYQKLFTIWDNNKFYTEKGQALFSQIFPNTSKNDFPQPKSLELIKEIIRTMTNKNDIILDSFAGSGTTGHAVMDLNRQDGGNRKYIMIEMEDYAESITAERMKKVIVGYGEGKKAVSGIDDSFSYYELGNPILINGNLNDDLDIEQIKSYIYFMETKQYTVSTHEPYYLGTHLYTGYYLYYQKGSITTLDYKFLEKITKVEENYVIYADRCILSEEELSNYHITFKKIPRDISKL